MAKKRNTINRDLKVADETQKNKIIFLECFEKAMAIVAPACDGANIARATFYRWYNEDEWFRSKVEEIREMQVDFVETALLRNIKNGKELSQIFYLKTKGKDRGYIEKQEVEPILPKDYIFKIEVVNGDKSEIIPEANDSSQVSDGGPGA